ncbi:lipid droplet assembly factor 1-like isoform X1 [Centroberyx affinis]|uniref:lipid droplet assembly factor 1-like isoform X1 n=2 Tax=Centroberyx affinis TaxID=166261 RepID=UPI003A5BF9B7
MNLRLGECEMPYSSDVTEAQQVWGRWTTLMNSLYKDPKVQQLMNTRIGQYLTSHPFLALTVLVFSTMATVPIGLFLVFALMTTTVTAVGFVFFEVFLLSVGGVTLLCVLSGLALLSILVSSILSVCYITTSNIFNFYYTPRTTSDREDKVRGKANGCETSGLVKEIQ